MAEMSFVNFDEVSAVERFDAEFYSPTVGELIKAVKRKKPKRLGDFITSAQRGQSPNYDPNGEIPVVRTVNVRELEFSETRQDYVTRQFYDGSEKGKITRNDLLVTSTGVGTLGRVFCNYVGLPRFADGHITILKPKPDTDIFLLTAILQSKIGSLQFEKWQRGSSGQVEIYPEDICEILIPELPDDIKKKVASLWKSAAEEIEHSSSYYPEAENELLERLEWKKAASEKQELHFVENFDSVVSFGRGDAEHFQPKYKRIREHLLRKKSVKLSSLYSSFSKGTQPNGYIDDGEIMVVKSKNVLGNGIDFENCERTTKDAYEDVSARLKAGDLVITTTGFGTLGRAAFMPKRTEKIVAAVDLFILGLNQDILPEYATLYLNSPAGRFQSEMYQTGSSGQLHLYPQHIQEILVYVPKNKDGTVDIAWQKKLADKVIGSSTAKQNAQTKLLQAKTLVEKAVGIRV